VPSLTHILAAQYLRMSTEHQQYSLDNQAAAIQEYARTHGFTVVRTYEDPGCSGLLLKRRRGLQRLSGSQAGRRQCSLPVDRF